MDYFMNPKRNLFIFALLNLFFISIVGAFVKNDALLQTTVWNMLGLQQTPKSSARPDLNLSYVRYMKQLYSLYLGNGNLATRADTVRCLWPKIVVREDQEYFLFNLTSLSVTDVIDQAKLRIFDETRNSNSTRFVVMLCRKANSANQCIRVNIGGRHAGWKTLDILRTVQECRSFTPCLLELRITGKLSKQIKAETVKSSKNVPYVVVASNEFPERTSLDVGNLINSADRRVSKNAFMALQRKRRSLLDNEIPHEAPGYDWTKLKSLKSHPSILKTRRKGGKRKYKKSKLLPFPSHGRHAFRRQRRKFRRRHRKGKNSGELIEFPVPKSWKQRRHNLSTSSDLPVRCSKKRLKIKFADMGWGEWIISPKALEANYCSGTCPFPLNKNVRPSNHATIQSIAHALGLEPHLPAPSCVPVSLSSVTLLFFDENKNVILKNFPGMSVRTCGCR